MNAQRPAKVSQYVWLMRFFGLAYALAALIAFFFPEELFYLVNVGPKVFKVTEAISDSNHGFWRVYAVGFMSALSALSFLASESPKVWGYSLTHLLSKVVTTLCFFSLFFGGNRLFAYLLFGTLDLFVVLILVIALIRISRK